MKSLEIIELKEQDIAHLRTLFFDCNDYFQMIDGVSVCGCRAGTEYEMKAVDLHKKHRYGVYLGGKLIGTVFAVEHYRFHGEFTISLLLLAPLYRGLGYGGQIYNQIEGQARSGDFTKIVVGVDEINQLALKFWKGNGFVETGERQHLQHETRSGDIIYLEKVLK